VLEGVVPRLAEHVQAEHGLEERRAGEGQRAFVICREAEADHGTSLEPIN
jgi:hypothetical protein